MGENQTRFEETSATVCTTETVGSPYTEQWLYICITMHIDGFASKPLHSIFSESDFIAALDRYGRSA